MPAGWAATGRRPSSRWCCPPGCRCQGSGAPTLPPPHAVPLPVARAQGAVVPTSEAAAGHAARPSVPAGCCGAPCSSLGDRQEGPSRGDALHHTRCMPKRCLLAALLTLQCAVPWCCVSGCLMPKTVPARCSTGGRSGFLLHALWKLFLGYLAHSPAPRRHQHCWLWWAHPSPWLLLASHLCSRIHSENG